jgi:large subunit ribosomal protein L9
MKVILVKDIDKLGKSGQTVKVSDGYARNYLLPQKFALEANTANERLFLELKKKAEQKEVKAKKEAEELAEKIRGLSCTIVRQAGEEEKLYGSVTNMDVASALQQEGLHIDKKRILLDEPIKSLGVFYVPIKLHPEVTTELKVWVVKA